MTVPPPHWATVKIKGDHPYTALAQRLANEHSKNDYSDHYYYPL